MIVSNNPGCDAPVIGNKITHRKGGKWSSLLCFGYHPNAMPERKHFCFRNPSLNVKYNLSNFPKEAQNGQLWVNTIPCCAKLCWFIITGATSHYQVNQLKIKFPVLRNHHHKLTLTQNLGFQCALIERIPRNAQRCY